MSRSIVSYPESQRLSVIHRRAQEQQGGLGYWAAIDAQRRLARVAKEAAQRARAGAPGEQDAA